MSARPPYAWERSYPAGTQWNARLDTTTLPDMLDGCIAQYGERPAIEYRDREISYRALGTLCDAAAAALLDLGLSHETLGLYLPNTPHHPLTLFGAARIGARVVQLSPLDSERELAFKLEDTGARVLVTTNRPALLEMARRLVAAGRLDRLIVGNDSRWGPSGIGCERIDESDDCLDFDRLLQWARVPPQWPTVARDDVVLLQFTGGTTGHPRAAMLTHANLTAAVASYRAWARGQTMLSPGRERVICVLPLFHIYALSAVLLRHFADGNEVLLRERFDVETALSDIEIKRATLFPGVPTMWIALMSRPDIAQRDFSSLRACASGGAPLPPQLAQQFQQTTGLTLRNGYGMTETAPAGTNMAQPDPVRPGSIGLPLPGIVLEVVDVNDPRRLLGPGQVGELRIMGANVMKGYWNRPEENEKAFVDGFFLTGDIGMMDQDGYFFLVDRKKDMLICGGYNVYPQVIEDAVYEHPDVAEVIVVGVPDAYRGEAAKVFIKLRPGSGPLTLEALRAFLADKLGRHEMPTALEIRAELPRTAVGKHSRRALAAELSSREEVPMSMGAAVAGPGRAGPAGRQP